MHTSHTHTGLLPSRPDGLRLLPQPAAPARQPQPAARVLIVPGLHDSPANHWQSWLQTVYADALRVTQRDWATPDVARWAGRIGSVVGRAGPGPLLVVAHSFGALALVRHLAECPDSPVAAVLLVAPADPDKFGIGALLPQGGLAIPGTMVLSTSDPWLSAASGQRLAQRWGCHAVNLGAAGHINAQSGFATLPLAQQWVDAQRRRLLALPCVHR